MNTLIIVSAWGGGGTERYAQYLARAHRAAGWNPCLFLEVRPLLRDGLGLFSSVNILNTDNKEDFEKKLIKFIEVNDVRLVHLNLWTDPFIYAFLEKVRSVAVIQTFHATFPDTSFYSLIKIWRLGQTYRRILFLLGRIVPRYPVICISEINFNRIKRIGSSRLACQIYCGVDPSEVLVKAPVDLLRIVWVGGLIKRKNPILAIRAFHLFRRLSTLSVELVMVGDGPLMSDCVELANQVGGVHLVGYDSNPLNIITSCNLMLITSIDEGLPYVAIEALSAGVPIVTTPCGAIGECLTNGAGVMTRDWDSASIASALVEVSRRDSWGGAHAAAIRMYEECFSYKIFAAQTIQFSRKVIEKQA